MMPTKINRPTISSHVKGPSAAVAEDGSVNNSAGASEGDLPVIGTGSRVMNRLRSQVAAQKEKARDMTIDYLDRSVAQTQQERFLRKQSELKAMVTTTTENLDSLKATDDLMQPSRARGNISLSRSADQSIGLIAPAQAITRTALQIGASSSSPALPASSSSSSNDKNGTT